MNRYEICSWNLRDGWLSALSWREFFFFFKWRNVFFKRKIFLFLSTHNFCVFGWEHHTFLLINFLCFFFLLLRNSENTKIKIHTYTQGGGVGWNVVNILFFFVFVFSKEMTGWKWRRGRLWYTVTHITRLNLFWKKIDNKKKKLFL